MYRTHTCGELNAAHIHLHVTLSGWAQTIRELGGMIFLDLRDRYGITQVVFHSDANSELITKAKSIGREYVLQVNGKVIERSNKNKNIPTGEIELIAEELTILNTSKTPPFTIEDQTDGGDDLRMKYRYLDLRRNPVKEKLLLRSKMSLAVRNYLYEQGFLEIETPFLIKSTPEGARDFVVPSRMNPGEFYALPQSPQTFKQILMVAGYDRYFQIVRCFRDEDLRADRQPEFTQIDCEMAFVDQEDVLQTFEGLTKHIFKQLKDIDLPVFPRMTYDEAMRLYGSDKPDTRFGMLFEDLTALAQGKGFVVFDQSEIVLGISVSGAASYTRKQLDELIDFVKKPQIGAKGLVYAKVEPDGSIKSTVDKFYSPEDLQLWAKQMNAKPGDLLLILSGEKNHTRKALNELRLEMGTRMGLRNPSVFSPLWVVDFPSLEYDEDTKRWYAMHHPFTSPKKEDIHYLETDLGKIRANAYDLVVNGVELGGGSVRIHDRSLQNKMFQVLGFTEQEAQKQFGFLLDAFEYGAPPHAGIAFGFDRLVAVLSGVDSIRDCIAFPKNNSGRDMMIQAPSTISEAQLEELALALR